MKDKNARLCDLVWVMLILPLMALACGTLAIPTATPVAFPTAMPTLTSTPIPRPSPTAGLLVQVPTLASSPTAVVSTSRQNVTECADLGWQGTRIWIASGGQVTIQYLSGEWTNWLGHVPVSDASSNYGYICAGAMPAEQCVEPIPDSWIGALIGKVSNQKLKIGNLLTFTSAIDGYLFLRMNDADMGLYDNAGTLTAQVMIQRSRAQVTIPTRTAQPTLPTPTDKIVVNDYMMLFDPDVNERPLTQNRGMADPHPLTAAFITDFESATGGSVVYRVAKESVIKTLPANVGGFTFTGEQYWAYVNSFATNAPEYCRRMADYQAVVNTRYDPEYVSACEAVARQGIDEVWEWEGGWFGFLEFKVISPNSLCPGLAREFTCMTFNYSRGVTEMLESQTHRTETVLQRKLGTHSWDQFDGQRQHYQEDYNQSPPPNTTHPEVDLNNAHCGNVHFPSNAFRHYQYDRNLPVQSDCDRWLNYPNLNRPKATINCSTGGCDRHQFLKWWLGHIPHNPGTSNGIYHN